MTRQNRTTKERRSLPPSYLLWMFCGGCVLLALYVAYSAGVSSLVYRWINSEEYSHGFFMPLLSMYFIWQQRGNVASREPQPSWMGVLVLLVAAILLVIGEMSATYVFIQYSLLLTLFGLVFALGGWSILKIVFAPLMMLAFAIPLPYFIDASLSWRLQLLSSEFGVGFMRLLDIPVVLEGNIIDLGIYSLEVVEACSGLRYLYPLVGLGFYLAYLYQAPLWARAILFFSCIPITVLVNSLRIGVTGVLVHHWGIGAADGFLHDFEGWIIFVLAAFILFFEMWIMTFLRSPRPKLHEVFGISPAPLPEISAWAGMRWPPRTVVTSVGLLCVVALLVTRIDSRSETIAERELFIRFPPIVGDWVAAEGYLEPRVIEKLGLDDYLLADYSDGEDHSLSLYIAYYATQRKGVSPHSPRVCMPGGGWAITELSTVELNVGAGVKFKANRAIIEKNGRKQLVYYWFQQRGRYLANEYLMKWYLVQDALLRHRTDGALVRVVTSLTDDQAAKDLTIRQFIGDIWPELSRYVPD